MSFEGKISSRLWISAFSLSKFDLYYLTDDIEIQY